MAALSSDYWKGSFISGLGGMTGVSFQTLSFLRVHSLLTHRYRKSETSVSYNSEPSFKRLRHFVLNNYTKCFTFALFARFGDMALNFGVLNTFNNSDTLCQVPLFAQTACVWALASSIRLVLLPIVLPEHITAI